MRDITVPKLNSNDDSYILLEWLLPDGDTVPEGTPVAVVETAKAAEELPSPHSGILHRLVKEQTECRPGEVIGHLFTDEDERLRYLSAPPAARAGDQDVEIVLTEPARDLVARHNLSMDAVRRLGKTVVSRADLEPLLADDGTPPADSGTIAWHTPSRHQQAVADVVTRSHREIPAGYAVCKVIVDAALAAARQAAEQDGYVAGLTELLVRAVAGQHSRFPVHFATWTDGGDVMLADAPSIGVTIDVGTGLFVPVLRDANQLSLRAVAEQLLAARMAAMRGEFRAEDLRGANIGVALAEDPIVLAQPMILPPMVAMVSLGARQQEPCLGPDGGLTTRSFVYLGLCYDHRLLNGRQAGLFLAALRDALQTPEGLRRLTT
ncbi:2-oxo acid dehydrogenase subunit E2 [Polymorphospora sp. NPDC050346]|uniref:2-oxo acid dehydrogenase subunit E2 n=1 Tax=Polymorphospora sp. NPDC050346 TaxID=3155780 RepID=UPI0033F4B67C